MQSSGLLSRFNSFRNAFHNNKLLHRAAQLGLWIAGIGLAVFPPALVVMERWLRMPWIRDSVRVLWCRSEFLCKTYLPSYFFWIIPAWVGLIILAAWAVRRQTPVQTQAASADAALTEELPAWQVRWAARFGLISGLILLASVGVGIGAKRIPGFEIALALLCYFISRWLMERPYFSLREQFQSGVKRLLPLAFGQLFLIFFLRDLASPGQSAWLSGLALLVVFVYLLFSRTVPPVYWIVSAALVLMTTQIGLWRFSVIGDEYSFFSTARFLLNNQTFWQMLERMFNGLLVYRSHPFLSSLIQAASMKLLGVDNFGWRFSSIYLAAVSLFFFYGFFQRFLSRRAALLTTALLGCSHYLLTFGKIGYNNLQALFALGVLLWAAGEAVSRRSRLAYAGMGAAMGLCLYVYPAALYALPLPLLLVLFYDPPTSRRVCGRYLAAVNAFVILFAPILFQPEYWAAKMPGTFLNPSTSIHQIELEVLLPTNLLYALFSYLYTVTETHFVVSSFVDPLTAALLPVGLGWMFGRLRRERFAGFWLLSFAFMLFAVGASHDRATPSTTRMFLLLPWFCGLAGVGLAWLGEQVRPWGERQTKQLLRGLSLGLPGLLLLAALLLNVYMAYGLSRTRTEGTPSLEVLFLRLMQRNQTVYGDSVKTFLFITQDNWGIDGFRELRDVYGLPQSQAQLVRTAVAQPELTVDMLSLAMNENTLVIVQPWMEPGLREGVEALLDNLGKKRCVVSDTPKTSPRFTYWYSERWRPLCPQDGNW